MSSFCTRGSHLDAATAVVDMVNCYDFAGNDIIGELTFGESFNCIGSEHAYPGNRMLHDI